MDIKTYQEIKSIIEANPSFSHRSIYQRLHSLGYNISSSSSHSVVRFIQIVVLKTRPLDLSDDDMLVYSMLINKRPYEEVFSSAKCSKAKLSSIQKLTLTEDQLLLRLKAKEDYVRPINQHLRTVKKKLETINRPEKSLASFSYWEHLVLFKLMEMGAEDVFESSNPQSATDLVVKTKNNEYIPIQVKTTTTKNNVLTFRLADKYQRKYHQHQAKHFILIDRDSGRMMILGNSVELPVRIDVNINDRPIIGGRKLHISDIELVSLDQLA